MTNSSRRVLKFRLSAACCLVILPALLLVQCSGCGDSANGSSSGAPPAGPSGAPSPAPGPPPAPGSSPTDVLTWHNDNARSGDNFTENILTPSNVNANSFGKLFNIPVDGKVDAQPLYVSNLALSGGGTHNVLLVATEHDSVFAFDADTGAKVWQASMLNPGETTSDVRNCSQIVPEIGVTATPVIDRKSGPHGTMYVVAMSKQGSGNYFQRLHALDLATGAEEFGGPVDIHASFPGSGDGSKSGTIIFDPGQYDDRAGLLLVNGVVYTSWSSHCDIRPYTGWIIGYDERTLAQRSVLNITPNGSDGAFWSSGGGLASDGSSLYALAGNGTFDATLTKR